MNETSMESWEQRILTTAGDLQYPPTPDIAGKVRHPFAEKRTPRSLAYRRSAWTVAFVLILLLATILLVPPVRAAVLDFLQIGAVRIFLVEPTATPTPTSTPAPSTSTPGHAGATSLSIDTQSATLTATPTAMPTATPTPTPIYLVSWLDLQGETTLDRALERLHFTLLLPTYPPDLGNPDHVFLQDQEGQVIYLIWTDPEILDKILLSLQVITKGSWGVTKMSPIVIDQTQVNGQEALWTEGPYPLRLTNGDVDFRRLVAGHVLIWEQDGLTYRLESDLTMNEAVKIAESLRPVSR